MGPTDQSSVGSSIIDRWIIDQSPVGRSLMPSVTLSYAELAARIGRTEIAAQSLAQRKRWKRSPGNDGKVRVTIDEADLANVAKADRRSTDRPIDHPPTNGRGARVTDRPTDRPNPVHELQAKLAVAQAQLAAAEARAADLQADRDRWHAQAERLAAREALALTDQTKPGAPATVPSVALEPRLPWWRRLIPDPTY